MPVLRLALTVLLMMFMTACSSDENAGPVSPEDNVATGLATITRATLEENLNYLASDERQGRMTGTQGHVDAANYMARQFEELGLKPAGDDGWFQHVPLIANRIDVSQSGVNLHHDSGDQSLRWKDDYVMGGDSVRDTTSVRAEVVFVGFGVHAPEAGYSDYDGIDVSGKIVALFGGAPAKFSHNERAYYSSSRTKYDEMTKRGAIGYIGLQSREYLARRPWSLTIQNAGLRPGMAWLNLAGDAADFHEQIEGGATFSVDSATDLFDGTMITFEQALDAADEGRPLSTPLGIEVTISQTSSHEEITSPNVIAVLQGSDPGLSKEYVVFSAHLDHVGTGEEVNGDNIYNGLYDNAMGSSLLIETARAMAAMPERPKRSVIFIAVTGEERGLLGSDYFAHYPTVPITSIVANVNLDMPLLLFPMADVIAFGAEHSSLAAPIEAAVGEEAFALTPDPWPAEVVFIRSDQYSFVRQGVPSVFLVGGIHSTDPSIDGQAVVLEHRKNHYHQPSDDLTRPVDWNSALRFARANVRIGYAVANDEARPSWNPNDFFGDKFSRR